MLGPTDDIPSRTLPVHEGRVAGALLRRRAARARRVDERRGTSRRSRTVLGRAVAAPGRARKKGAIAASRPAAAARRGRPERRGGLADLHERRRASRVRSRPAAGRRVRRAAGARGRAAARGRGGAGVPGGGQARDRDRARGVAGSRDGGGAARRRSGSASVVFAGGDARQRYRTWLRDPGRRRSTSSWGPGRRCSRRCPRSGLIWVARESHPAHREERAPYYHVRDVALRARRARRCGGVLAAACPSTEAAALGLPTVRRRQRSGGRTVEVVRPGAEGRAPRLVRALGDVRRAFLFSPLPGLRGGAGLPRRAARRRRARPAAARCARPSGEVRCVVCEAPGRCAHCGGVVVRGAARRRGAGGGVGRPCGARCPSRAARRVRGSRRRRRGPRRRARRRCATSASAGSTSSRSSTPTSRPRRPGLTARERALAIWMEAVGWARPSGSAIVQTAHPGDPAVQALVRGNPDRFHERERARRAEAGFPVGAPVFRVVGTDALEREARGARADHDRSSRRSEAGRYACSRSSPTGSRPSGDAMRRLAAAGVVERVEAEPHL